MFRAGWTVTMLGLDVTLRTGASAAMLQRMSELGALGTELLRRPSSSTGRSASPARGGGGAPPWGPPPVHDVCAVAWVAQPELFGMVPARVQVELAGQFTAGMTVTDFAAGGEVDSGNSLVAMRIDVDRFWEVALEAYARVAGAMSR